MKTISTHTNSAKKIVIELLQFADVSINGAAPWDVHLHNEQFYNIMISEFSPCGITIYSIVPVVLKLEIFNYGKPFFLKQDSKNATMSLDNFS